MTLFVMRMILLHGGARVLPEHIWARTACGIIRITSSKG
jgi:hypothetical protein